MIKQLRKVGNSNALLLDKALLELLGLDEKGRVQLTFQDGSLIITPVHPNPVAPEQLERCLDKVVVRRQSALRKLAQ